MSELARRVGAEALGSCLLAAAVIGSGVMAERLAAGNVALALLANTLATVAALGTLIAVLAPVSGAHFNPAVSIVEALRGALSRSDLLPYLAAQFAGCCLGALLANGMFGLPLLQYSTHVRSGGGQWLSEIVATSGLIIVVVGSADAGGVAWRVAAWIGAAYWFTASTSFANPAITVARALSDTFAGIRPADVPGFVAAQSFGAMLGLLLAQPLFRRLSTAQSAAIPPRSEKTRPRP